MKFADLWPVEARRAVLATRYDQLVGGVRVSEAGTCPVSDLLAHPSINGREFPNLWKPVMDRGGDVVAILVYVDRLAPFDAYSTIDEYAAAIDRAYDEATPLVEEFCEGWDNGTITEARLRDILGAGAG